MSIILVGDAKAKRNLSYLMNGVLGLLVIGLIVGVVIDREPMSNLFLLILIGPLLWLRYMHQRAEIATFENGVNYARRILAGSSRLDKWFLRQEWWRKMASLNKEHRRGMEEALETERID